MTVSKDTVASIEARVAAIDRKLSEQLNAIMHHPKFQRSKAPGAGCTTW